MTAHTRRAFLAASTLGLAGCAQQRIPLAAPAMPRPQLPRVRVSAGRVIRSIAGLRPFRPSGFVVRAQKLDTKTVIHNYGHGGAGITLSWGTAQLAVDLAPRDGSRDCAVLAAVSWDSPRRASSRSGDSPR
jgi:glycine/D-amino acid oxidase-like deaminating enzyme